MTIVVTGASGTIGSALMEELAGEGRPVRGVYHTEEKTSDARRKGFEGVTADLDDLSSLATALEGADVLFLLGATGPAQAAQELNVVRSAVTAGVEHLVKLSVWRAPDELTVFARVHRQVEEEIEAGPMPWTFLRPNFFMQTFLARMGPRIRSVRGFGQPRLGPAAYIDTRDVARVAARELIDPSPSGTMLSLTGSEALAYPDLASILSDVIGEPVTYSEVPIAALRDTMTAAGASSYLIDAVVSLADAYRDGGAEETTSTVEQITGAVPTSFRTFLEDHADQLR